MTALPAYPQPFVTTEFTDSGFGITVPGPEVDEPVEAQQVERLLSGAELPIPLPAPLERRFHKDVSHQRLRTMITSGMVVTVIYNWFLVSDWLLLPDQFEWALRLRLFMFTPAIMVAIFLLPRISSPALREWATVIPGVAAAGINGWLCMNSTDPYAAPYLACLATIVMFSNSVVQMRFTTAAVLNSLIMAIFVIAAVNMPREQLTILVPGALLLACTIILCLYSCYCQERDERLNWLLHLRERLLLQDLEAANLELHEASRSDLLTEVANRRHFDERLPEIWERAKESGAEVALMMIDVDHFKAYNDRYGHPAGDTCLKSVAGALKRRLRGPGDLIARFGGEEFIAVLSDTSLKTAQGAADRIRKGIEGLNILHATSSSDAVVTASIGVTTLRPSDPSASMTRLISLADKALYQAKAEGRNRVVALGGDA